MYRGLQRCSMSPESKLRAGRLSHGCEGSECTCSNRRDREAEWVTEVGIERGAFAAETGPPPAWAEALGRVGSVETTSRLDNPNYHRPQTSASAKRAAVRTDRAEALCPTGFRHRQTTERSRRCVSPKDPKGSVIRQLHLDASRARCQEAPAEMDSWIKKTGSKTLANRSRR